MSKFFIDPKTGCAQWTAYIDKDGYGRFNMGGRSGRIIRAHIFAYEMFVGPIPLGHELDHLCRNRGCCNPEHLEAVTKAENIRRGNGGQHWANKTHCPKRHPYKGGNLYVEPSTGRRRCQICTAATRKRYRDKIRVAA